MAIPYATKNELKALDERVTAAEQVPVASVRNALHVYFHTIELAGASEEVSTNLTVTLYSTTNETLTAGLVDKQEVIDKVFSKIVNYDSIDFEGKSSEDSNIPVGFAIYNNTVAFVWALAFDQFTQVYNITNIVSDTVGEIGE